MHVLTYIYEKRKMHLDFERVPYIFKAKKQIVVLKSNKRTFRADVTFFVALPKPPFL